MDGLTMEISVIIPCYNLESYISRCLESIMRQKYDKDELEIIVILDSCTDKSEDVARGILEQSGARAKIVTASVRNAGSARNIGLDIARGEYVYFMDGDDYLTDADALLKLKAKMTESDCNAVYMEAFESEDKTIKEADAIWRFFYKRNLIGNTRFLPAPINEDWLFVWAIRRKPNYKESRICNILYHYTHPREGSITAKYANMLNPT